MSFSQVSIDVQPRFGRVPAEFSLEVQLSFRSSFTRVSAEYVEEKIGGAKPRPKGSWAPDGHRTAVGWPSGIGRTAIGRPSGAHRAAVEQPFEN